jgi:CBS domain-containing protein
MTSSFYLLRHLLRNLLEDKQAVTENNSFSGIAVISYSKDQEQSAKCLKGLLDTGGLHTILHKRGSRVFSKKLLNELDYYFSFLPHDYGSFNEDNRFRQEIALLITSGQDCRVIFLEDQEVPSPALQVLAQSVSASINRDVAIIDFLTFRDEVFDTSKKLERMYMLSPRTEMDIPLTAESHAEKIMTKFSELLTVTPDSPFSELFYRMVSLGVRHMPVIDSEEKKNYLRVITRRDLVAKVPPGSAYLPEDAQIDCGISLDKKELKQELKELGKKRIREIFNDEQNLSICVKRTDPIRKVITLFARPQELVGGRQGYVSAIPVLENGKLEGIISYTDVFRKFLKSQDDFLNSNVAVVSKLGRMADNNVIDTLSESDKLNDAFLTFSATGRRALPVVADGDESILVGYLEDLQMKIFNHTNRAFAAQLGNLGVEYMMTRADRLYTPYPEQRLKEFIDQFWKPLNGAAPASSFVVCSKKVGEKDSTEIADSKEIAGILSYVNVFDKWLDPTCWDK